MDEVGRGTTIEDGLAIAFSTVHHLSSDVKCRALFATHFHELADMLGQSTDDPASGSFGDISFYCTGVDETEVSISRSAPVFLRAPTHARFTIGWVFQLLLST